MHFIFNTLYTLSISFSNRLKVLYNINPDFLNSFLKIRSVALSGNLPVFFQEGILPSFFKLLYIW